MNCCCDVRTDKRQFPETGVHRELFLEQFAALEEGLALVQTQLRGLSENARLFSGLVRHIRRSICPTTS